MPLFVTMLALKRLGSATQRQLAAVTGRHRGTILRDLRQLKVEEDKSRNERNQPVKVYSLAAVKSDTRPTS